MRPLLWMSLTVAAIAGLSASPARAQFAAEDSVLADNSASDYGAEAPVPEADYDYDPAAVPADAYAVDPGYQAAPSRPIVDRTVGDLTASVLGVKGIQHVQDAEAVVREVIGKGGAQGAPLATPSTSDAISLVREVLGVVRKQKDPQ